MITSSRLQWNATLETETMSIENF